MFSFDTMITPILVEVVWIIGLVVSVIGGIAFIAIGIHDHDESQILGGVATLLLGPLILRLISESAVLFFRINDTLDNMYGLLYVHVDPPAVDDGTADEDEAV